MRQRVKNLLMVIPMILLTAPAFSAADHLLAAKGETKKSEEAPLSCGEIRDGLDRIKVGKPAWSQLKLDVAETQQALSYLQRIDYPTLARANSLVQDLKSNDTNKNAEFFLVIGLDCASVRWNIVQALANTYADAATSDADREMIKSGLRGLFQTPKYPTLINLTIEITAMKAAISKKVWIVPPAVSERLKSLEKQVQSNRDQELVKVKPIWSEMETAVASQKKIDPQNSETQDMIRSLVKTHSFAQMKPLVIDEVTQVQKQFAELREIDLSLR